MFDLIKPGYVLRFGAAPAQPEGNLLTGNTTIHNWGIGRQDLNGIRCISHSSSIGKICSAVANHFRQGGNVKSRSASYSYMGRRFRQVTFRQNHTIGQVNADFVGYCDGQTNFVNSTRTVLSKDFSGCLMVVYTDTNVRRVAHVASSGVPHMDCKHSFLDHLLHDNNSRLIGWFQPFVGARDNDRKVPTATWLINNNYVTDVNCIVTFGVITAANVAYTFDAFRPRNMGNDWIVTHTAHKVMSPLYAFT